MSQNRYVRGITLDPVQVKVKNRLGYVDVQVEGLKVIYDFISRFAWCQSVSPNFENKIYSLGEVKINGQDIPLKTREILESVGTERINLFYSPLAYPRFFEEFCKKIMKEAQGRLVVRHYAIEGLLEIHDKKENKHKGVTSKFDCVVVEYEE